MFTEAVLTKPRNEYSSNRSLDYLGELRRKVYSSVIVRVALALFLCSGWIQWQRQHKGQRPPLKQRRDIIAIGNANSSPHTLRIKAGSKSGPVADLTSRDFKILRTSRSRIRKNRRSECRAGLNTVFSLTCGSGKCAFSEKNRC